MEDCYFPRRRRARKKIGLLNHSRQQRMRGKNAGSVYSLGAKKTLDAARKCPSCQTMTKCTSIALTANDGKKGRQKFAQITPSRNTEKIVCVERRRRRQCCRETTHRSSSIQVVENVPDTVNRNEETRLMLVTMSDDAERETMDHYFPHLGREAR